MMGRARNTGSSYNILVGKRGRNEELLRSLRGTRGDNIKMNIKKD